MNNQTKVGKWKAVIINLGCKVNKYEADSMKDKLIAAGFAMVEPEEKADVYIINTCAVTNMAQKKSRQMLRRARRKNPEAVVVAVGCYVNAEHAVLKQEEFIDIVVGNNCKKDIVCVIADYMRKREKQDFYIDIGQTREYEEMGSLAAEHLDHQRAYIKIQDGCNQFCSYCIIPYTRGRVRSRSSELIVEEIRSLAEEGVKEFVLTGIHISSYGVDFEENEEVKDLGELIERIGEIPEVRRIRLGSLEPRIITEAFVQKLSQIEKLCPHFHLSLQSACNETLKRMNRKYTVEEFKEKCEILRRYFDKPAITTDVIVGFPGETEEEFAVTVENLKELNLYEIHVFKYSVRAGTVAEKLPNQVAEGIKGQRSDILLALTAEQKNAYEHSMKGYEDEVLVEEMLAGGELPEEMIVVIPVSEEKSGNLSGQSGGKNTQNNVQYFTGHTKRYVKVGIAAKSNLLNRVVRVRF